MDITEYKSKLEKLKIEYNEKIKELKKEFILSNDTLKVGDFIRDNTGSGIIKKIIIDFDAKDIANIYYYCEITFSNFKRKSVKKYRRFYKDELI